MFGYSVYFSGNDRITCINFGLFIFLPKFSIGLFGFSLFGFSLGLFDVGFWLSVFLPTTTPNVLLTLIPNNTYIVQQQLQPLAATARDKGSESAGVVCTPCGVDDKVTVAPSAAVASSIAAGSKPRQRTKPD
jgi:hypothetical protein